MLDIDGFTGPQRFFLGWAQVWRARPARPRRSGCSPWTRTRRSTSAATRSATSRFHEAFGVEPADRMWLPEEGESASSDLAPAKRLQRLSLKPTWDLTKPSRS